MERTNKMTYLKPCPFCGGEAYISVMIQGIAAVYCRQCGASIAAQHDEAAAVRAWNQHENASERLEKFSAVLWHETLIMQEDYDEHRWIPVEEKTPEKDGDYLVCDIYGNIFRAFFGTAENRWSAKSALISHWMPLPKLPEQVKAESDAAIAAWQARPDRPNNAAEWIKENCRLIRQMDDEELTRYFTRLIIGKEQKIAPGPPKEEA